MHILLLIQEKNMQTDTNFSYVSFFALSARTHESALWKSVRFDKSLKTNWKVVEKYFLSVDAVDNINRKKRFLSCSGKWEWKLRCERKLSLRFWACSWMLWENFLFYVTSCDLIMRIDKNNKKYVLLYIELLNEKNMI